MFKKLSKERQMRSIVITAMALMFCSTAIFSPAAALTPKQQLSDQMKTNFEETSDVSSSPIISIDFIRPKPSEIMYIFDRWELQFPILQEMITTIIGPITIRVEVANITEWYHIQLYCEDTHGRRYEPLPIYSPFPVDKTFDWFFDVRTTGILTIGCEVYEGEELFTSASVEVWKLF